ncbi:hypothetical protein ACFL3F_04970, partial [Planctomycetota bacterium]
SLADSLSLTGISNVERIVVTDEIHALRFQTTHFTPYYIVGSDSSAVSGGGGGGGCALSPACNVRPSEFFLPYVGLGLILGILRIRDRRRPLVAHNSPVD